MNVKQNFGKIKSCSLTPYIIEAYKALEAKLIQVPSEFCQIYLSHKSDLTRHIRKIMLGHIHYIGLH